MNAYSPQGKVHLIRGKVVHFPLKKSEMAVKSTFSAGKCTKKAGKWTNEVLLVPFSVRIQKKPRCARGFLR